MKEWVSMASPMGALPLWSISFVKLGRTQHSLLCDFSGGDVHLWWLKKCLHLSLALSTSEVAAATSGSLGDRKAATLLQSLPQRVTITKAMRPELLLSMQAVVLLVWDPHSLVVIYCFNPIWEAPCEYWNILSFLSFISFLKVVFFISWIYEPLSLNVSILR